MTRDDPASGERGTERDRGLRRGLVAAAVARAISLGSGVVLVPVLLGQLGPSAFGVWTTITSLTLLVGFADLGLSNGLVNLVAAARRRGRDDEAAIEVSSAFALLTAVAVALALLVWVASSAFDLSVLLGDTGTPGREAETAIVVAGIAFVIGLPLAAVLRIHMGFQETATAYLWMALGPVLSLAGAIAVALAGGGLVAAVAATSAGPVAAAGLNAIVLFGFRRRWLRPRPSRVSSASVRSMLRVGGYWFGIQVSMALSYQTDALIISHVLGPRAVTDYAVPARMFAFLPAFLSMSLAPLWPAVKDALAAGDVEWARSAFRRMLRLTILATLPVVTVLILAGPEIVSWWTSGDVEASTPLLLALAGWAATTCLLVPLSYTLAGADEYRFQAWTHGLMTVANLSASVPVTHLIGIEGAVLVNIAAQTLFVLLPSAWRVRHVLLAGRGAVAR